jgi:hypothetical protein
MQSVQKDLATLYWEEPDKFSRFNMRGINWAARGTVSLDEAEAFAKMILGLVKEGRKIEKRHQEANFSYEDAIFF